MGNEQNNTTGTIVSVILLIVGFAVAGLMFTFTTVLSGQTYNLVESDLDGITSYSDYNGTFTAKNTTWVSVGHPLIDNSTWTLHNATTFKDVTANFTVNYTTGMVKLKAGHLNPRHNTLCRAVYSYDDELIKTAIKSGILSNFEAQQEIGNYTPIIALAVIITIIIGLIIGGIAERFMGPVMRSNDENGAIL